jgi:hypothetical protein
MHSSVGRACPLLFVLLLGLTSCADGELRDRLRKCPKVVAAFGPNPAIAWTKTIGSAGVWDPPTEGCNRVAQVEGSAGTGRVYYTQGTFKPCFHAENPHAKPHPTIIDINACSGVEH